MPNGWIKADTFPCGQRNLDPSSVCISLSTEQYKGMGNEATWDFKPIYKTGWLRYRGENPKALSEAYKDTNRDLSTRFPSSNCGKYLDVRESKTGSEKLDWNCPAMSVLHRQGQLSFVKETICHHTSPILHHSLKKCWDFFPGDCPMESN